LKGMCWKIRLSFKSNR